tara:strand:+ start:294 stop:473 length:180 start_codon:yes stop_codon:yes gene_type:complete
MLGIPNVTGLKARMFVGLVATVFAVNGPFKKEGTLSGGNVTNPVPDSSVDTGVQAPFTS